MAGEVTVQVPLPDASPPYVPKLVMVRELTLAPEQRAASWVPRRSSVGASPSSRGPPQAASSRPGHTAYRETFHRCRFMVAVLFRNEIRFPEYRMNPDKLDHALSPFHRFRGSGLPDRTQWLARLGFGKRRPVPWRYEGTEASPAVAPPPADVWW